MANGLTLRQNVESLELTSSGLAALRDAYGKMQALSADDNRSWMYLAGFHGFPQFQCWHGGRVGLSQQALKYDLFLPWHRAYLLTLEHTARDQNNAASLSWWDWTSAGSHKVGVPAAFSTRRIGKNPNPLASGPVPEVRAGRVAGLPATPARNTTRAPGNPSDLPTSDQVNSVLALTDFVDFSEQLQDIHDQVHGWTGGRTGDMGTIVFAGFDPIFWAHHCMIDRIWYLWQLRHGVQNVPPDYMAKPLAPFPLTVGDVLDIHRLGYEYAQASSSHA